ncbi:N/A [soil metagenome]
MINYTDNYFDIKLIKLSELLTHEATEHVRLDRVLGRITKDRFLNNPVIVGKYKDKLILLDGANRYSSLKSLGCKLILAQVIEYASPKTRLQNWNHIFYNLELSDIKDFCDKNGLKFKSVSLKEGKDNVFNSFSSILCSNTFNNENILIFLPKGTDQMLASLSKFTRHFFEKYEFDRSESEIKISDLRKYSRRKGLLTIYPNFTKDKIVSMASKGLKIPAGITRHLIQNRVLHLKYELSKLLVDKDIDKKNAELKKSITKKIDANKVRQYQESVIVFDE